MLCKTTTNQRGGNRGASFLSKAGLTLAAILGTLLLANPADAQYRDDYFRNDNARTYQPATYERDDRSNNYLPGDYDYERNTGSRLNRPVYGDFQGDRYSPEPNYGSNSRDRLSRLDSRPRRNRLNDRLNNRLNDPPSRDEYTTRRIPLPDFENDRLNLDRSRQPKRDIRYRDNYDNYGPYEAPLPLDSDPPQLPLSNDYRNAPRNDYRNDYRNAPRNDYRNNGRNKNDYLPPRPAIPPTNHLSETEEIQQRLSARYGNPVVGRFLYNVSPEQTLNVYREASQLIDSRHLQPTSYEARTQRAATNLIQGLRNREFLAANRISPSAAQVRNFESAMNQLLQSRPVRNQNDAVQMVYAMANVAHQQAGIRPTTVVLEFVYGSTETLDKYSTFLPEETRRQPSASALDSSVVGIGVEVKPHEEGIEVVKALRGGPAQAAGLQPGDIIAGINGQSIRGQNLNQAVDLIAGPVGSPIYLTVVRSGRQLSPITMTRREVKIYSVSETRMMGNQRDVGYIKLDKFAQSSSEEMDEALWNLHRSGMKSLVIDLRGNPGGLLTTAIELSNKFLPSGTIVSTRGRTAQDNMSEQANSSQTWNVPLVVLVDENSASASEIFAAAIQENGRGVIVGHKSYGKGTVQTHFPLRSVGGNLKLTTAKFYSPKGREMAGAGVTPDVQVTATSYRGALNTADNFIQSALEVAESGRVRDYLASSTGLRSPIGR